MFVNTLKQLLRLVSASAVDFRHIGNTYRHKGRRRRNLLLGLSSFLIVIVFHLGCKKYKIYSKLASKLFGFATKTTGCDYHGPNCNGNTKQCSTIATAGSLHNFLMGLSKTHGSIGYIYWNKSTKIAYITSSAVLYHRRNRILQTLDQKPASLFFGFVPLLGLKNIVFIKDKEKMWDRYRKIYVGGYGSRILHKKLPIMSMNAQSLKRKWEQQICHNDSSENTESVHVFDAVKEIFLFASKSVIFSSFGRHISEELCNTIANGYHVAWHEMEERLINGNPSDAEREQRFQHSLTAMRESVKTILEMNRNAMAIAPALKHKQTETLMDDNEEEKEEEHVFLNHVLSNPTLYPTEEDILDEAITAITGGTHTTGNTIAWILYYISIHQNVQEQMVNEIRRVFPKISTNTNANGGGLRGRRSWMDIQRLLQRLQYCKQVINETLRITSLAPWAARVNHEQNMTLCDENGQNAWQIPKNMPLLIGLGCALNDDKVWPNPQQFNVHRWNRQQMTALQKKCQLLVFGGLGKRICPGFQFFYTEALLFLMEVLPHFRFALADAALEQRMQFQHGFVTSPSEPILLKTSIRK